MENPNKKLEQEIKRHQKELAEQIVDCHYKLDPSYWEKFGEEGRKLSLRDAGYHLLYLSEAIWSDETSMFCQTQKMMIKIYARSMGHENVTYI